MNARGVGRLPLTWLLDLDNTLHDAGTAIMPRINGGMTAYVARHLQVDENEASAVRVRYWRRYGATLLGMIRHHDVDPHEFLQDTHVFPDLHELVRRQHALVQMLRRLPGRKILVSNAPRHYAHGVIRHLGIRHVFDRVICIEDMQFAGRWQPKPSPAMMRRLLAREKLQPQRTVMVEDSIENLLAARRCGLRTVWVRGLFREAAARAQRAAPGVSRHRVRRHPAVDFQIQSVLTLARLAIR